MYLCPDREFLIIGFHVQCLDLKDLLRLYTPQLNLPLMPYCWWSFSILYPCLVVLFVSFSSSVLLAGLTTYRLITAAPAALYIPLAPTTLRRERGLGCSILESVLTLHFPSVRKIIFHMFGFSNKTMESILN